MERAGSETGGSVLPYVTSRGQSAIDAVSGNGGAGVTMNRT